uniref:Uncharacterized protein n=1 Tax=Salmo trutta TaxID=8032 RepID=A0A673XFK6_SALTR
MDTHKADTSGSPSSSAGPCRPARSPGRAGRSTGPEAPSYSNKCSQTEGPPRQGQTERERGERGTCSLIGNCSGPMSFSRAEALVP